MKTIFFIYIKFINTKTAITYPNLFITFLCKVINQLNSCYKHFR